MVTTINLIIVIMLGLHDSPAFHTELIFMCLSVLPADLKLPPLLHFFFHLFSKFFPSQIRVVSVSVPETVLYTYVYFLNHPSPGVSFRLLN